MRNRALFPPTDLARLALCTLLLLPALAQARFMAIDANFDNRTPGSDLQRRGAVFGEPVPGPFDRERETVVDQGGGDMAIELFDTQILGPSEMYWALRDGLTVTGGLLNARIEFLATANGDYTIALRAADLLTDFVAIDIVDNGSANRIEWRDADDPVGTFLGFASSIDPLEIRWEVDLNDGTYTLWLDGAAVTTGEAHGLAGEAMAALVVGHVDDNNAVGEFQFDLIELDWRPDGSVPFLLEADFSDKPAGEPLLARGAYYGEPATISFGSQPTVEFGLPNGNKAMVFPDDGPGAQNARFEFYNGHEPTLAPVSISLAVAFDSIDDYEIGLREQGTSTSVFMDLRFTPAGQITVSDPGGLVLVPFNYAPDTRYVVEIAVEPALNLYSLWIDGERVAHRRSHGITARDVGALLVGVNSDAASDGVIRADRIRARTLGEPVAAPDLASVATVRLLGAAPNPFNPATEIRFELPRPARVRLDIFDGRGRHVRRLVSGNLAAGLHRPRWQGRDDAGRTLASGVYLARLEADGAIATRALTLLK